MIYKLQNGWTIPLGGDYLEYLQNIPEVSGGSIQSSVKTEKLPKKFNGSQKAARTYAEGYQKGAKPVTKAIDNAGQKIFNTTKNIAMFVPGPIGATTWLGQMGADTANGEYSKVAKDLGAAILIGAGLKGAQVGAKAAGRALAGKGVNIPWLDAYDYSALRNEYLNRAAKRARVITPNKGYDNFSNLDVYKDVFYNHPAIEITEPVTDVPNIPRIKVGNLKDIAKLRVSPSSAMETGYIDFFDESKPFRRDLRKAYDIVRDGTSYHFGHPLEEGVIYRTRNGYEFLEYPRGSNTRYYTGKIKTEGYTPTLVHEGEPNMKGTIQLPRPDPFKRNSEDYLWWQRNQPWVRYTKGKTVRINDVIPTKAAWGSDYTNPIRLSGPFDLSDPNLNATMMEYNPLTKTWAKVKYHVPQSTILPQEAATTYHFDGRMPLSKSISEAEGLGIPKALRSNPKALEDPYYWGYQQWNSRYNTAVNSGNLQEAQRLRDLHFKIKAPDTKVVNENDMPLEVYHFTSNPSIKKFRPSSEKYTSIIWFDTKYNGQYTVTPEEGFIRRNQGGEARVNYIKTHPIDNSKLNTTSYGETTIEEQMNLANRTFAKKYASQFPENFHKAIQYEAVSPPTYGYSEGTILGPFVDKFGIEPGQIKVWHAKDDARPLPRIVDSHEGHHVSGNMDDVYVLRRLIESGIVDEAKLTNYLKDADRGEPTAHISELLDWLGFTGYKDGYYTGHPYGKNSVSDIDIRRYNWFLHKNNFKHTFFDAIYKDKLQEFAKFVNVHPFALTLPITGLSLTATQLPQKEKQGGIIKGQNGFLNTWQKAYNSKFGKGLRDFLYGKDRDLSDEEYLEKYGYNKPVGGIGVLGALVAPEWEGLEIPEITAQHFGNQGKVLRWFESGNSKMLKVPVKETSKKVSNWQKFLKLSQQEQDDFVRRWNGESFQGFATLKGDKQALGKFRSWINSRK